LEAEGAADGVPGDDPEALQVDDVPGVGAVLRHVEPRRLGGLDVEVTGGDGPPGDRVAVAPQGEGRPAEEECRARSSGDEAGRLLVHDRFSLCWVLSARTTRGRGGSCSPSAVLGCSWAGQGPVGVTGPEAVHTISSPG